MHNNPRSDICVGFRAPVDWGIQLQVSHLFVLRTAFLQEANLLFSWDHPRQHRNDLFVNYSHHKSNQHYQLHCRGGLGRGGGQPNHGPLTFYSQAMLPSGQRPFYNFHPPKRDSFIECYVLTGCPPPGRCLHNQKLVLRTVVPGRKNMMAKSTLPGGIYKKNQPLPRNFRM